MNVEFQPSELLFLLKSNNWGTMYFQSPYPGDSLVCQFPRGAPPQPWGLIFIGALPESNTETPSNSDTSLGQTLC